jgi:hypothetical protein
MWYNRTQVKKGTRQPVEAKEGYKLATVTIPQEALPVVQSSIALKRQALELNLSTYRSRLAKFEKQHRMTSGQFEVAFHAGDLCDNAEWFEWEFVQDAYREAERQLELLDSTEL